MKAEAMIETPRNIKRSTRASQNGEGAVEEGMTHRKIC